MTVQVTITRHKKHEYSTSYDEAYDNAVTFAALLVLVVGHHFLFQILQRNLNKNHQLWISGVILLILITTFDRIVSIVMKYLHQDSTNGEVIDVYCPSNIHYNRPARVAPVLPINYNITMFQSNPQTGEDHEGEQWEEHFEGVDEQTYQENIDFLMTYQQNAIFTQSLSA